MTNPNREQITILSELDRYRLHCKKTTGIETFCGIPVSQLVYINTIQLILPAAYFCPCCYNGAVTALKDAYPPDQDD